MITSWRIISGKNKESKVTSKSYRKLKIWCIYFNAMNLTCLFFVFFVIVNNNYIILNHCNYQCKMRIEFVIHEFISNRGVLTNSCNKKGEFKIERMLSNSVFWFSHCTFSDYIVYSSFFTAVTRLLIMGNLRNCLYSSALLAIVWAKFSF